MATLLQIGLSNALMATLLAVVAVCVGRVCRRPALTHSLWLLVLLKLVTPPLVFVPVAWPDGPAKSAERDVTVAEATLGDVAITAPIAPPQAGEGAEPVTRPADVAADPEPILREPDVTPAEAIAVTAPDPARALALASASTSEASVANSFPWTLLAGGVWLFGSLVLLGVAVVRIRRFQRLLRHAQSAPRSLREEAEALSRRIGLIRCPAIWLVPGVVSPMLWALGRSPLLLLPAGLLERLGAQERATLLVHELAHLRRRDHWIRILELFVLGLYWWFPLAWWARRELGEAEEECCDAWVVWALPDSARAYATALVETLDFLCGAPIVLPAAASGVGHLYFLRRRLTMILRGTTPRALTGTGLLCVVGMGLLLLPLVPSWAQAPQGDPYGGRPPSSEQIERARADLAKKMAELAKSRQAIAKQQEELERQAKQLEEAMKRMQSDPAGWSNWVPKKGQMKPDPGMGGMGWGPMAGKAQPDLERRLKDMENKMDLLLRELLQLREEMRRGGRPGPGGPGGGGAPMGGGGTPFGRGRGGLPGGGGPTTPPTPPTPPNTGRFPGEQPPTSNPNPRNPLGNPPAQ